MAQCKCKRPPGGGTGCPKGNAAVCQIINGACQGWCVPIPSRVLNGSNDEMAVWFLTGLLGRRVSLNDLHTNEEIARIVRTSTYFDFDTGTIVRFELPRGEGAVVETVGEPESFTLKFLFGPDVTRIFEAIRDQWTHNLDEDAAITAEVVSAKALFGKKFKKVQKYRAGESEEAT